MSSVTLDEIVFDDSIYPRAAWSQATVDRYADALQADEHFPPIILEAGTRRLLDGKHRVEAHAAVGRHFIAADFHEIPEGVPAVLYAASLSARHGDPLAAEDKRRVARDIAESNPDFSMVTIAALLGATRQTVSRYVADLVERRREVRKAQATLLDRAGWSHRQIGEHLGVDHKTVGSDVTSNISPQSEDILREAAEELPIDAEPIIATILAERAAPAEPTPKTPGPTEADAAPSADPGTTPEHYHVGGSAGVPGENSAECACGVFFDGFDSHAEVIEELDRHIEPPEPAAAPDVSTVAAGSGTTSPAPEPGEASEPEPSPGIEAALRRAARFELRRVVDALAPVGGPDNYLETWCRQLGPYDEELVELIDRAHNALAALDDLISEAGK